MADKIAFITAVENYSDKHINPVSYAEADANGYADAIALHGYQIQAILLSSKATKTSLESNLSRGLKRLGPDDEFIFYYAGHGFSKNGHNFITAYDTDLADLENTSIRLQHVFDLIEKSKCKRIKLFLDSCESGITKMAKGRALYSKMSDAELDEFFKSAEYRVCFSACKTSEYSYSSNTLKHGIWTHHLIEAISGGALEALETSQRLTAVSLQNYLSKEVPRTLRKTYVEPYVQTPWRYGGESHDFQIADLRQILEERNQIKPGYEQLKQTFLRDVESIPISSLSGYVKRAHRVPTYVSSSTEAFVESISQKEVDERADSVYDNLRERLKYKRRDLTLKSGRIIGADFEYAVYCKQDHENPDEALIVEELTKIKPTMLENEGFNEVFDGRFSEVVFEFPSEFEVAELIDQIEEADRDDCKIDYDKSASWCELSFEKSNFRVRVRGSELVVTSTVKKSPKELIQGFFEIQKSLGSTVLVPALNG